MGHGKETPKWEDPEGMHAKQLPSDRIPQLLQWFYAGKATFPIFPDLGPAGSYKPRTNQPIYPTTNILHTCLLPVSWLASAMSVVYISITLHFHLTFSPDY